MYSGYGIAFDGKGAWSFVIDYALNLLIFGGDNSSQSHADNRKNNFLVLVERSSFNINGSFSAPGKKIIINFIKVKTDFSLSLHYNSDNSYLFVHRKEIFKLKVNNVNLNYLTHLFSRKHS